jgi:hypothetical protein
VQDQENNSKWLEKLHKTAVMLIEKFYFISVYQTKNMRLKVNMGCFEIEFQNSF